MQRGESPWTKEAEGAEAARRSYFVFSPCAGVGTKSTSHDPALHNLFTQQIHLQIPFRKLLLLASLLKAAANIPTIVTLRRPNIADLAIKMEGLHAFVNDLASRDSASPGFIGPFANTSRFYQSFDIKATKGIIFNTVPVFISDENSPATTTGMPTLNTDAGSQNSAPHFVETLELLGTTKCGILELVVMAEERLAICHDCVNRRIVDTTTLRRAYERCINLE